MSQQPKVNILPVTDDWIVAQEMSETHRATSEPPTEEELKKIAKDMQVKIYNGYEFVWVTVAAIDGKNVTGVVDNHLCDNTKYDYGTTIAFELKHVYEIQIPGEIAAAWGRFIKRLMEEEQK